MKEDVNLEMNNIWKLKIWPKFDHQSQQFLLNVHKNLWQKAQIVLDWGINKY